MAGSFDMALKIKGPHKVKTTEGKPSDQLEPLWYFYP